MSLADDVKRAHDAIRNNETRAKIEEIAREKSISFNAAMKEYLSKDEK